MPKADILVWMSSDQKDWSYQTEVAIGAITSWRRRTGLHAHCAAGAVAQVCISWSGSFRRRWRRRVVRDRWFEALVLNTSNSPPPSDFLIGRDSALRARIAVSVSMLVSARQSTIIPMQLPAYQQAVLWLSEAK